jgi:hypothetical protein
MFIQIEQLQNQYNKTTSARWQRVADRLAWYAWLVLLLSITTGLIGGLIAAVDVIWQPTETVQVVDECASPPCFGGGGMPGLQDLPWVLPMLGYALVILLGAPSLLAAVWDFLRGRWGAAGRRTLPFVGPLLFLVGTEIVPHLLNPCFLVLELGGMRFPGMCEYGELGADFAGRWHLLDHTLVGAIPFAALYWLALRKWRPDVGRFPRAFRG